MKNKTEGYVRHEGAVKAALRGLQAVSEEGLEFSNAGLIEGAVYPTGGITLTTFFPDGGIDRKFVMRVTVEGEYLW